MPYSQTDHDYATEVGGVGMVVTVVLIVAVLVGALLW